MGGEKLAGGGVEAGSGVDAGVITARAARQVRDFATRKSRYAAHSTRSTSSMLKDGIKKTNGRSGLA